MDIQTEYVVIFHPHRAERYTRLIKPKMVLGIHNDGDDGFQFQMEYVHD